MSDFEILEPVFLRFSGVEDFQNRIFFSLKA